MESLGIHLSSKFSLTANVTSAMPRKGTRLLIVFAYSGLLLVVCRPAHTLLFHVVLIQQSPKFA